MQPAHYRIRRFIEVDSGFDAQCAASVERNGQTLELEDGETWSDAIRVAVAKLRAARKLYGKGFGLAMGDESATQSAFRARVLEGSPVS